MITAETLRALIALVEEAKAGSRELDAELWWHLSGSERIDRRMLRYAAKNGVLNALDATYTMGWRDVSRGIVPPLTTSVDAARALAARLLPDFWMSSGLCSLTGHASIGPDYNGPAGDRLRSEWPEADFHSGFHADLAPGDGPHRECYAILSCMLQALLAKEELAASAARSFVEKSVKEAGHGE